VHFNHICTTKCIEEGVHILSDTEQIEFRESLCQEVMGISRVEFIEGLKSGRYELDHDAGYKDDTYPVNYCSLIFSLTDLELLYIDQAKKFKQEK